jgi:hypothetical protein
VRSSVFILLFLLPFFTKIQAQSVISESLFTDDYNIDSGKSGTLGLSIDNISFLHNIETNGDIFQGYTLPGLRINPRLVYQPIDIIRLEAGLSLLRYWGADKYPNYAYQDISEWKADGYQYGFHVLPFFRAQIQPIPQVNIVLGHIYGGSTHGLIEPLYNPELNLTADPETGFQFLYNSRVAHFDTWVNWESFTFRNDTHNEVVTVGNSTCFHITNPQSFFYLGIPVQALVVHHGGEIDINTDETVTLINGGAGLRFGLNIDHDLFKHAGLDILGAGYKAYFTDIPLFFDNGWAFYANLNFQIRDFSLEMSVWRSGDFINLYGSPVFGNVSTAVKGRNFPRTIVYNPRLKYEHEFGSGYYAGARVEYFHNPHLLGYDNYIPLEKINAFNWVSGVYLRINPSIIFNK